MKKRYKSTILSCLIWGSGQFFFCKQRLKGLLFFAMQAVLVSIELNTGYWINYFAGQIANFKIRLYGGFFTRGIWGLITLGEVPGAKGDHSARLMIGGLIALLVLFIFLAVYVGNILDAYKCGKAMENALATANTKQSRSKQIKKKYPYMILFPVAVLLLFITAMPILFSVLVAFTNYDSNHIPPNTLLDWIGFQNFARVFNSPIWTKTFFLVLRWTIVWTICATFTSYFAGLLQALILHSPHVKHKALFRSIYILPWAIPGMISLMVFKNVLNEQFGPLNQFLLDIGLISTRIPFLTDSVLAKISILAVNLWISWPMFFVMLTGVLSNQDPTLYEAARIDGAGKSQVLLKIKLPLLMHATAPLIVMNLSFNFTAFGTIYFLTGGQPTEPSYQFAAGSTDILISWIYKLTIQQRMYSMASVMSILLFIFIAAVSYWNFKRTTSFKEV